VGQLLLALLLAVSRVLNTALRHPHVDADVRLVHELRDGDVAGDAVR